MFFFSSFECMCVCRNAPSRKRLAGEELDEEGRVLGRNHSRVLSCGRMAVFRAVFTLKITRRAVWQAHFSLVLMRGGGLPAKIDTDLAGHTHGALPRRAWGTRMSIPNLGMEGVCCIQTSSHSVLLSSTWTVSICKSSYPTNAISNLSFQVHPVEHCILPNPSLEALSFETHQPAHGLS